MDKQLEQRIKQLEQRVTAPEGQVQEQSSAKIEITNVDEFKKLIAEAIEKLDKIKNFKFNIKVSD
ncbi:hypothetical protein [Clostridium sp. JN-1]|uniref:hypothetical protein n=1 Tax=Clostridium sp. JN-1 TaxID=2483110 RepID=UPI000F0B66AF|nr:hypothetical protein [Clostridium sp. JN-1]